ncbi:hypothetical protein RB195_005896 [Necator americanus]|uniref:Reverse transcriptase domain-containing protein n=1 Tax=Necator americanus TaxID=51031 RepID=A0ABR1BTW9_NECAM
MYKVLERIILDRLIKHREQPTRDEQAGFRPGRSTIDQVFIVRRVIEIWQRYSKPMQLAFLDFEAAFNSPHRFRHRRNYAKNSRPVSCRHCLSTIRMPLTDLEYADDVVIFAESSTKLQHVVTLVSKLAAAYRLGLCLDKCKQI